MVSNTSPPAAGNQSPLIGSADNTNPAQRAVLDVATKAKDMPQAVAQAAVDTVDQNRGTAAQALMNAASTLRDGATRHGGGEGVTQFAAAAADGIDATAHYVREHNTQQMVADVKRFVSRHPRASVVGAAVVGILVGRGFRKHQ